MPWIDPGNRTSSRLAVVDGKGDIECGSTTITLTRQQRVDFSLPTFVTGGSVLSLRTAGINSMSDLAGKKIGVAQDTTTVEELRNYLKENLIDAEIVIVESRDAGKRQLDRGAIDALASEIRKVMAFAARRMAWIRSKGEGFPPCCI